MFRVSMMFGLVAAMGCASSNNPTPTPAPGTGSTPMPTMTYDAGYVAPTPQPVADAGTTPAPSPTPGADAGMTTPTPTPTPTDPLSVCMAQATNQCEQCGCNNCLNLLNTCEDDPGCIAIRDCGRTTGCRGIDCYGLLAPGPCRAVIDAHGGLLGASTTQASMVSDCYTGSCPGC